MRASLEGALAHQGCHLDKDSAAVVDGYLACSAVSQQGTVAIKKVRTLLRRWQERGHLTYIDAYDRCDPLGPRKRRGRYNVARQGQVST